MTRMYSIAVLVLLLALGLTGCGGKNSAQQTTIGSVSRSGISADRCEANRRAGEITYLTGFDYSASASTVDVVLAKKLGYFEKMCLNVKLQSGFTTANIPLVSEGKAQFTGLGSLSEIADANKKGAKLQAIAIYGHQSIEALAAAPSIADIKAIKGTSMGVLGSIPFSIRVMLVKAGVPLDSFTQLQVSYDPTQLKDGKFSSRPVYKSNEPRQLDAAGVQYRLFDPSQNSDVPASFGVMTVNKDFANAHPSAVEDFLRADLKGFAYAVEHPEEGVAAAYEKADPKYYLTKEGEAFRWNTEIRLVKESQRGKPTFGYIDVDRANAELDTLINDLGLAKSRNEFQSPFTSKYLDAVYAKDALVWPAQ